MLGKHDNVLAGMQKLLETSDEFENPNFASAYVFELRRDAQERYYVQVLHKNNKYPDEEIKLSPVSVLGNLNSLTFLSMHGFQRP